MSARVPEAEAKDRNVVSVLKFGGEGQNLVQLPVPPVKFAVA